MLTNQSALVLPPPPAESNLPDIRALKPPVDLGDGWSWIWWVLALGLILAAAWYLWRQFRPATTTSSAEPPTPPHVLARQRLQHALTLLSDPKAFCTEVSDCLRAYLEARFQFHAPERTTEEFLLELQSTDRLLPDQKSSLQEFLQACDLVKFARHEPNETALLELHKAAGRLVDETQFDDTPQRHIPIAPPSAPSTARQPERERVAAEPPTQPSP